MDILLTHGYFMNEDPIERSVRKPYPPLGILYIASWLRHRGIDAEVLDSTFLSWPEFHEAIVTKRPSLVGIYANLMTRGNALRAISLCKSIGANVILGGPEPANYAEQYLESGADVIVSGEGELTVEALVEHIAGHGLNRLEEIAGIVFRGSNGKLVETPPRAFIRPLDDRPFPARDAIDLTKYLDTWKEAHGYSSVSVITARGCPYRCRWCSHSVYGFSYRHRSPQDVAEELDLIRAEYAPDQIWYADDVFTMNHRWLYEFAAELKRRNIAIPFETISREDRLNEKVVRTLADLGCQRLWVGAESGSQRILDAMERRTDAERLREMIRLLQQHDIRAGTFIMVGYEGETWDDLEATVRHLKEALPDDLLTTRSYPIKGTPFYDEVKDRLIAGPDWATSSDRDLDIAGRPSKAFHDHAQQWLVNEVEFSRATRSGDFSLRRALRAFAVAKRHRAAMYLKRGELETGHS